MGVEMRFSSIGIILLLCSTASAAPKTSDGNAAVVKAQGIIRQLTQEKSALQAEKQQWQTEKADLEARVQALDNAAARLPTLQAELERYKAALDATRGHLESQLGQERSSRQALLDKHNTVVGKAKAIHADNLLLVNAVKEREQWIAQCGEQNQALRKANLELVDKYRGKGFWQKVAEVEPFTGIGQVDSETLAEEYHYKLKQLQVTPFEAAAGEPEAVPAETPVADERGGQ